jgi:hypothetical protein
MLATIIGVAIGLAFVYLLLSLLATWVQELLATLLSWRARELANAIQNLLDPSAAKLDGVKRLEEQWAQGAGLVRRLRENFLKALYDSPVVKGLSKPNRRPSYIPSREFSLAVFDLVAKAGSEASPSRKGLEAFKRGVSRLNPGACREALESFAEYAEQQRGAIEDRVAAVRRRIGEWFDAAMERASGWYKRRLQVVAIVVGLLLAVAFNADTLLLASRLWSESWLRDSVKASAQQYLESGQKEEATAALERLESLGLPLGWSSGNLPQSGRTSLVGAWLLRVLGWLLTGFAVSQGSPVWFDLLSRLVNLRGTGKKPDAPLASAGPAQ